MGTTHVYAGGIAVVSEAIVTWKLSTERYAWPGYGGFRKPPRMSSGLHPRPPGAPAYSAADLIEFKWQRRRAPEVIGTPEVPPVIRPGELPYPRGLIRLFCLGLLLVGLGLCALLLANVAPAFDGGLASSLLLATGCLFITGAIFRGQAIRGIG